MKGERMGKKDIIDKKIEKNNDVFADIFNTLLFKEEVIRPEKLKPGVTNVIVEDKEADKDRYRDECKLYEESSLVVVSLGIENQTEKDNLMPLRVMGYDYGEYLGQIINVKKTKLPYLYPSITLVLNFSDTRWRRPRSLKECIRYNKKLWPYVNDYKIYVVDMNFLSDEEIRKFKSDLGGILKILKDIREDKFEPSKYNYKFAHPDDAYKFISTYLKDERLEKAINDMKEESKEKEETTVCEAFDKLINEGIEKGRKQGIQEGIQQGIQEGIISTLKDMVATGDITMETAAKQMKVTVEEFENIIKED